VVLVKSRPGRFRGAGRDVVLPALSELERVDVPGVGTLEAFLTDGLFDVVKAGTISRLGYRDYAQVMELFSMKPPPAVLDH
jgi:hypothetical protein